MYLFIFLIVIARCQSALLHLLPLHLSCLLTGFLRPWYVTNCQWRLWKFKFNFFYDALVVILQVLYHSFPTRWDLGTPSWPPVTPRLETPFLKCRYRVTWSDLLRLQFLDLFLKLRMISDHIRWRDLGLHEFQELLVSHRSWGSSGAWGDEGHNLYNIEWWFQFQNNCCRFLVPRATALDRLLRPSLSPSTVSLPSSLFSSPSY